MSIRSKTIEEHEFKFDDYEDFVGRCWFIRTVTFHTVGLAVKRVGIFLVLKNASWVADSGRFTDALKTGELNEVELVDDVLINMNSIVDVFEWRHPLPNKQK